MLPFEVVAGSYDSYPVTQIRVSESEKELSTLQWDIYKRVGPFGRLEDKFFKSKVFKTKRLWLIDVVGKEWGVDLDLVSMIKAAANEGI